MQNQGWVKIHRKLLEWEWYDNSNVKVLFLHLLLNCNFKEKSWRGINIKPGQIVVGIEKFGKEAGLSYQQTRSAINQLKSTGEITIEGTNSFSILTLTNWNDYQENNEQTNEPVTNQQRADNEPITTTKECKERKNVKNDKNISTNVDSEPQKFGNENINKMLQAIQLKVRCDDFKESKQMQRIWGSNLYNLMVKISPMEFSRRLDIILEDNFKHKNAGSLAYLYREIKGFVEQNQNISFIS